MGTTIAIIVIIIFVVAIIIVILRLAMAGPRVGDQVNRLGKNHQETQQNNQQWGELMLSGRFPIVLRDDGPPAPED